MTPAPMRIDDAIHGLMAVSKRTVMLIAWLLVALLHLAALSIALVLLWWLQVTPQEIRAWADSFFHQGPIATIAETVGLLGLSLGAPFLGLSRPATHRSERELQFLRFLPAFFLLIAVYLTSSSKADQENGREFFRTKTVRESAQVEPGTGQLSRWNRSTTGSSYGDGFLQGLRERNS